MRYLLNSELMKQADQFTIATKKIPARELMERAAQACVDYIYSSRLDTSQVMAVCGPGNNGGDGFAIASLLKAHGVEVTAVLIGNQEKCTAETKYQIQRFEKTGGNILPSVPSANYSLLIDALFGVGLNRNAQGEYRTAIEAMNASDGFKLSVDIPSGISADSGVILGAAVRADATITFQEVKLGLELYPGKSCTGQLIPVDIGIEASRQKQDEHAVCVFERKDIRALLPKRPENSHKGTYGKVLLIAGSKGMSGAAYLAAKAAYMSGAGLVQIYTAEENRVILQSLLPEAIIKTYEFFDERELLALLKWADAVSIGSGIGMTDKAKKLIKTVTEYAEVPCIIDADGLNLLAEHERYLEHLGGGPFIFTPHMKEMARLIKADMATLQQQRTTFLNAYVQRHQITCVLKDARTLMASPGQQLCLNISGNAAMAKAGSGDVLAGIITGLAAQGIPCRAAGILGTYLHGRAGDMAREKKGSYSVMASDLIDYLAAAFLEQERCQDERV